LNNLNKFFDCFNRLKEKNEVAFIPFVVLGDPNFDTSLEIVKTLVDSGADALELGFAFSDPIADGKTIQAADQRALANNIDTEKNFELIKKIRSFSQSIPISLLVYYNLILQRGIEKFYSDAKKAGVDAILAADCPIEESLQLCSAAEKFGINQVFLVAPTTTKKRLKKILQYASGYIYLVSVLGVTGARTVLEARTVETIKQTKKFTSLPICVGFGISNPSQIKEAIFAGADGIIVGSAIIKMISENLGDKQKMLSIVSAFVKELKSACLQ
jgi:tryptophan synthase alpha chain